MRRWVVIGLVLVLSLLTAIAIGTGFIGIKVDLPPSSGPPIDAALRIWIWVWGAILVFAVIGVVAVARLIWRLIRRISR